MLFTLEAASSSAFFGSAFPSRTACTASPTASETRGYLASTGRTFLAFRRLTTKGFTPGYFFVYALYFGCLHSDALIGRPPPARAQCKRSFLAPSPFSQCPP